MTVDIHGHVFHEGADTSRAPLVLLHGSDGTEHDLLPLAEEVSPGGAAAGIRGSVVMDGGYGFFRRFPDRTVDVTDLTARVSALTKYVRDLGSLHWPGRRPVLLGYSNGAIMGAALLLADPTLTSGAILLRPLRPFPDDPGLRIDGFPVLVLDGEDDHRRSPGDGLAVADQLRRLGAAVTHRVLPVGHAVSDLDRHIIRAWLLGGDR